MPSEEHVQGLMVIYALASPRLRESIETGLLGAEMVRAASKTDELKGLSVTMDPEWADILTPLLNAPEEEQEATATALRRLKDLVKEREAPSGKVPTELSVFMFYTPAVPDDDRFIGYAREAAASRHGPEVPELRFCQPVHIPEEALPLPDRPITVDFAHLMYLKMVELGALPDYGKPTDGTEFTTSDGVPLAVLFFWHGSEAGEKETEKKGLFRRR